MPPGNQAAALSTCFISGSHIREQPNSDRQRIRGTILIVFVFGKRKAVAN